MLLFEIAFLKGVPVPLITLACMTPCLIFVLYVLWDDARQARAHRRHDAKH